MLGSLSNGLWFLLLSIHSWFGFWLQYCYFPSGNYLFILIPCVLMHWLFSAPAVCLGVGSGMWGWLANQSITAPQSCDWIEILRGSQPDQKKCNELAFYQLSSRETSFLLQCDCWHSYWETELARGMMIKTAEGKGWTMWTPRSSPAFKMLLKIFLLIFFSFWFNKFSFCLNQLIEYSVNAITKESWFNQLFIWRWLEWIQFLERKWKDLIY